MIKGIMFDKDGTLLEYAPFWIGVTENAIRLILKNHNIEAGFIDTVFKSIEAYDGILGLFYYGTYGDYADKINEAFKNNGYDAMLTREEVASAFHKSISCGKIIPTCENIREIFSRLKEMNIKTAIVTTDSRKITEHCLDVLGIHEYIDRVYADDGVNPTKPNPYYMNCFCEDYGFDSTETAMVGDTMLDMDFAKNVNVMAVGVAKPEKDKKILSQKADVVLNDISHIFEIL